MATVKVKFRPSSAEEKEGTVYYQVIHDRKPRQITTEYHVHSKEWCEQRSSPVCSSGSPRSAYLLSIRERIRMDVERLARIIERLDRSLLSYTSDDIVEEYQKIMSENTLFIYMEGVIARLKCDGKIRTSENYRAALNSFKRYRKGEDILLECLGRDLMQSYESWQKQRGMAPNTISFYIRILRAVYNRAVDDELIIDRNPFRKVYTGIERTVKRALPMKTIKRIGGLDLSHNAKMAYARDMFMLSFMLRGMSLIDMAFLKKSDLCNGYLTYRRRKTGQQLMIEWTSDMQGIVNKYPTNATDYLLPIIRNPNAVPLYAYRNEGYVINRQLKKVAACLELPIPLTMYVARHSWASAAKARGVPVSVISEGMGHDSELTTQIYLSNLDTTDVDKANSLLLKDLRQ